MTYLLLAASLLLMLAGSAASFVDSFKSSVYYVPTFIALCIANGWVFTAGARLADTKEDLYVFSLLYDLAMVVAYYVVPVLVFGVKLSPGLIVGSLLMLAGLLVVKLT